MNEEEEAGEKKRGFTNRKKNNKNRMNLQDLK